MATDQSSVSETELRQSVGESFNIFQATVAMIAIFMGFVFSGLLQLLTSVDALDTSRIVVIWILTIAMLLLSLAIICFHATAHRVVRYWRIFYPVSIFNRIGAIAFSMGLLMMLWSIALLLWIKDIKVAGGVVAISAVALVVFGFHFRSMHGAAPYVVKVDEVRSVEH